MTGMVLIWKLTFGYVDVNDEAYEENNNHPFGHFLLVGATNLYPDEIVDTYQNCGGNRFSMWIRLKYNLWKKKETRGWSQGASICLEIYVYCSYVLSMGS